MNPIIPPLESIQVMIISSIVWILLVMGIQIVKSAWQVITMRGDK